MLTTTNPIDVFNRLNAEHPFTSELDVRFTDDTDTELLVYCKRDNAEAADKIADELCVLLHQFQHVGEESLAFIDDDKTTWVMLIPEIQEIQAVGIDDPEWFIEHKLFEFRWKIEDEPSSLNLSEVVDLLLANDSLTKGFGFLMVSDDKFLIHFRGLYPTLAANIKWCINQANIEEKWSVLGVNCRNEGRSFESGGSDVFAMVCNVDEDPTDGSKTKNVETLVNLCFWSATTASLNASQTEFLPHIFRDSQTKPVERQG